MAAAGLRAELLECRLGSAPGSHGNVADDRLVGSAGAGAVEAHGVRGPLRPEDLVTSRNRENARVEP
jgi:hypothetical protein